MKKIFHITPHLGGGVGKVLLNWITKDKNNCHEIATLDYGNENAIKVCADNNIALFPRSSIQILNEKISSFDIAVIHFWNHPLLYDFLIRNEFPASRIIVWSHISGANPPYVFNKKILDICDKLIYTTPLSYNYFVKNSKTDCILSTGGIEEFNKLQPSKHKGYNACYIGTVDFAKMHSDFVKTLAKTNADKIFVAGGDREKEIFKNADEKFVVMGKIQNVKEVLSKSDVFAYLLNPNHYGTGEQVLQEAMAAGVVPVVLNNACEKTLVEHNKTGLIAKNLDEYVEYINLLKENKNLREELSNNAREYANKHFSIENLINEWQKIFDEVINLPQISKKWKTEKENLISYEIFLESLGDYAQDFEKQLKQNPKELLNKNEWSSETKGTPKQYYDFLGGEKLGKILKYY